MQCLFIYFLQRCSNLFYYYKSKRTDQPVRFKLLVTCLELLLLHKTKLLSTAYCTAGNHCISIFYYATYCQRLNLHAHSASLPQTNHMQISNRTIKLGMKQAFTQGHCSLLGIEPTTFTTDIELYAAAHLANNGVFF